MFFIAVYTFVNFSFGIISENLAFSRALSCQPINMYSVPPATPDQLLTICTKVWFFI